MIKDKEYVHVPVLLSEVISGLDIKQNGIYVDCTLGGGGHASEILKQIPNGHLYGFDQDPFAILKATSKLSEVGKNFTIIQSNFVNLKEELLSIGVEKVDGFLFDLGVSSFQLDDGERGFSYHVDAELDMRMDPDNSVTAQTIVNEYSESQLVKIFFEFGEEKFSKQIARKIIQSRTQKTIRNTLELVDVIKSALPIAVLHKKSHPARHIFQALRIAVNRELDVLTPSFSAAKEMLNSSGRICVITFHSLEDRITKQLFKEWTSEPVIPGLPFIPDELKPKYNLITKKAIDPSDDELEKNSRSHSAKLRIIEKK